MSSVPNLLNDDGTASMATAIMMSHHGLRRDLARFTRALQAVSSGETARLDALRDEWQMFHATLHGHHEAEDTGLFPHLAARHETLRGTLEKLDADHRRIDPLLAAGDRAFAELHRPEAAARVIDELVGLLGPHLAIEEAELVPLLRDETSFPAPPTEEAVELYAKGFAWAMHGVAPDVLQQVDLLLPEALRSKLPAARAAFEARCARVWGTTRAGAARTPIPDEPRP